ncbi:MAG: C40 family peptidase [Beijerinckiaceae bacterium]
MSATLDRRVNPFREDIAAEYLKGSVNAARFVAGTVQQIAVPHTPVRRHPVHDAAMDCEALHGDIITVYDESDGWLWAQSARDGYVGYIEAAAATRQTHASTHRVHVRRTFVYSEPNIKKSVIGALPMASELYVVGNEGRFALLSDRKAVWADHLRPLSHQDNDFVSVAEGMEGAPYLWGGNTPDGLDCSGLVQIALRMAGVNAPRDSDMQESQLGHSISDGKMETSLRRGDLIFWKGHVGIMCDAETLLHANGHHMLVMREPLRQAADRIVAKGGGPVTSIRRLNVAAI